VAALKAPVVPRDSGSLAVLAKKQGSGHGD